MSIPSSITNNNISDISQSMAVCGVPSQDGIKSSVEDSISSAHGNIPTDKSSDPSSSILDIVLAKDIGVDSDDEDVL
jgi:hypothetical protein